MNNNLKSNVVRVSHFTTVPESRPRRFAGRAILAVGASLLACALSAQQNPPGTNHAHPHASPGTTSAPTAISQPPASQAATRATAEAAARKLKVAASGDFFIVSSIDTKAQQIVLKRPTEVTQLVQVNAQTQYLDENGQPLKLQNLRAGDTVFVVLQQKSAAIPIATSIRRGPMTVDILRQRYLSGAGS
jgi:hypothetical protein